MLYSVAEGTGIAMKLRDGRSGVRVSVGASDFFFLQNVQTGSVVHSAPDSRGTGALFGGQRGRSVKLSSHLHTAPRLGISGAIRMHLLAVMHSRSAQEQLYVFYRRVAEHSAQSVRLCPLWFNTRGI